MKDQVLFRKLKERERLLAQIQQLTKEADTLKDAVMAEMERRGTTALENEEFRISYVTAEKLVYNYDVLAEKLTPAELKRVTKRVLDLDALSAQVQAGRISASKVAAATSVTFNKPYIRVSSRT
jgi:hypothetical protein